MSAQVWIALLTLLVGSGGLAGIIALAMKAAKKSGQKQAEAEYAQTQITNAKAAGIVVAEHRTPGDASRRLRDGSF